METSVQGHIQRIKDLIQKFEARKAASRDELTKHALNAMVQKGKMAIAHYELAQQLEKELSVEDAKAASTSASS
jgi:hypothetical protein